MTSAGREWLKWVALLLMTGDHVNKVLFQGQLPWLTEVARIAFPVFAVVLAFNMARDGANYRKQVWRLVAWGAVAQPCHAIAFGYGLPLNVLWTFAAAVAVIWALSVKRYLWALALYLGLSLLVDYQWAGVGLTVAAWAYFRNHGKAKWLVGSWDWRRARLYVMTPVWVWLSMVALCAYNGNAWALVALPVVSVLAHVPVGPARIGKGFYGYYVAHLGVLVVVALAGFVR